LCYELRFAPVAKQKDAAPIGAKNAVRIERLSIETGFSPFNQNQKSNGFSQNLKKYEFKTKILTTSAFAIFFKLTRSGN
jgi:hypothetical protein